jgi:CRP-like cAMP-binding protein
MEKLKTYFENIGFSGNELDQILGAFTYKEFKKNDFFTEIGKTSKHLGFLESGMFQYYVLKDGEERTTYISIENTFLASLLSFINETPALENVRALTDGTICLITKTNLKKLVNEIPQFKDFYIGLLEWAICGIDADRHSLIVLSGEERYEKMLKEEPHLLQQIPLQYLASMLGVTPRHLSRIRNNIR